VRNGGALLAPQCYAYFDLPKHVIRNVSRVCLHAHTHGEILSLARQVWTLAYALVLLCTMGYIFFHCQDTKYLLLFFFLPGFDVETPYLLHTLPDY